MKWILKLFVLIFGISLFSLSYGGFFQGFTQGYSDWSKISDDHKKNKLVIFPKTSHQGCCSWHQGVCGCQSGRAVCCDGTLSPSCGC